MNLQKFKSTLIAENQKKRHTLLKIDTTATFEKQITKIARYLSKKVNFYDYIPTEANPIEDKSGITFYEPNTYISGDRLLTDNEKKLLIDLFDKNGKFTNFYILPNCTELTAYSKLSAGSWMLKKDRTTKVKNICISDLIFKELLEELDLKSIYRLDKLSKCKEYYEKNYNTNFSNIQNTQNTINNYVAKINGVVYQVNEQNHLSREFTRATITERKKQTGEANDKLIKSLEIFKNTKIEVDKDNDWSKLLEFKEHFTKLVSKIQTPISLNQFKIRYLGNYKAIGLYVDSLKMIAIDLRDTTAITHEIGHYIDFNTAEQQLSLKPEFNSILDLYITDLKQGKNLAKKFEYYSQPTEIFARCFDYYCQVSEIVPNEIKHKKTPDYEIIFNNQKLQEKISNYFTALNNIKAA